MTTSLLPHAITHSSPSHLSLHVGGDPCIQQLLHNVVMSLCGSQVQCPSVVLHPQVDLAVGREELMNHVGVAVPD